MPFFICGLKLTFVAGYNRHLSAKTGAVTRKQNAFKNAQITLTNGGNGGIIFSNKQKGKKFGKHCPDWCLDPSIDEDRDKMEEIIRFINANRDEVREGPFNGQATDVLFYIKGNDIVITKQNGEFITVLKEGIEDGWVKNARRR